MTRGSIFAKAGLIARGIVAKGMIGYFAYGLGTMIFSQAPRLGRYELMLQQLSEVKEKYDDTLRFLDKSDEELVQLKKMIFE